MVHAVVISVVGVLFLVTGHAIPAVFCIGVGMFALGRHLAATGTGGFDFNEELVTSPGTVNDETVRCRCGRRVRVDRTIGTPKCPGCKRKL